MIVSIFRKNKKTRLFLITAALVCTSAVLYIVASRRADIPKWVNWERKTFYDSTSGYEIELRRKSAIVKYNGDVTWSSPDGVKVQQALSGDIDNDGYDELILLCWRQGHFGAHKPFWIDETDYDDEEWTQHIFVYEYGVPSAGEIHSKWQSSYIGQDVAEISISGSKTPDYRLVLTAPDGQTSVWLWDSWGFVREDE